MGNMGQRYASILNFLEVKWVGFDVKQGGPKPAHGHFGAVIDATPTFNHYDTILGHLETAADVPLLAEKPITKSKAAIELLVSKFGSSPFKLMMINQYRHLGKFNKEGVTSYDYFKSGADGLIWDCINIIGLSSGIIRLSNKSPIWGCKINGSTVFPDMMDYAYIENIKRFLNAAFIPNSFDWKAELEYIANSHRKVHSYLEGEI